MHNKSKKLAAMLLVFTMLFSLLPVSAFADNDEAETAAVEAEAVIAEVETEAADETEEEPAEPAEEETPAEPADEQDEEAIIIEGELEAEELEALPIFIGRSGKVNPLYSDILSEDDIVYPPYPNPYVNFMGDTAEECNSSYEAAIAVRSGMKSRMEVIELAVHSSTVLFTSEETLSAYCESLEPVIFEHTRRPTEGDYIRWQWDRMGYSCNVYYSKGEYVHLLTYYVKYKTSAEQELWMNGEVANLCAELARDTDVETIRAVYDYVCANVKYDGDNLNDEDYSLKYTAYAALHDHTAVCQGYALLMYRLLLEEDIDCRLIAGIGNGGPHGWNIVKIGSLYYDIDATWDAGQTNYNYFLTCEETFTKNYHDHFRYDEYATAEFMAAYPMSPYDYQDSIIIENGIVYYIQDETAIVAGCSEEIESLVIPASVNGYPVLGIIDGAFADNAALNEIHISDGVQYIDDWAFAGCWNLTEVELPDTLRYLGEGAFAYCDGLTSVEIPVGLKEISVAAFYDCCNLTSVTIPQSVTYIGESAFSGTRLLEVNYDGNDLLDIDIEGGNECIEHAYYCDGGSVYITWAEGQCLLELIDSTLTVRCQSDVNECAMPDYNSIGDVPWYWARAYIDHIVVESGITSIGIRAFEGCHNLADVTAADGVVDVGEYAFYDCYNLYSLSFTNSVSTIGDNAFANCGGLSVIYFTGSPSDLYSIEISGGNEVLNDVTVYFNQSSSSGLCGENVMWSIEDGVLTISGTGAMFDYSPETPAPWSDRIDEIAVVVIGDGVTHIGDYAFYDCSNVTTFVATNSVASFGTNALGNCTSLREVFFDGTVEDVRSIEIAEGNEAVYYTYFYLDLEGNSGICGDNAVWYFDDGVLTIAGMGEVYDYTPGDDEAPWLRHREEITSVIVENGITALCTGAFFECENLAEVSLPETLLSIADAAFFGCNSLTDIVIPEGVTEIGQSAFIECYFLESVTLPSTIASIATTAFHFTNPSVVYFNGTMAQWFAVEIDDEYGGNVGLYDAEQHFTADGFSGTCGQNLTWTLMNGVLTISGSGAMTDFDNYEMPWCRCRSGVKSVIIEDGVTTIGRYAFMSCENLSEIEIPGSVAQIGYCAFAFCDSITDIYYHGTQADWDSITHLEDNYDYLTDAEMHFVSELVITKQPKDVTAVSGETAKFSITAEGDGLSYQWQIKTLTAAVWTTIGSGKTTLSLSVSGARNGSQVRCIVTDAYGNTVTSDAATLIVFVITRQPESVTAKVGETAKFAVDATGTKLSYQWQIKTVSNPVWTNIGSGKATLSASVSAERDGAQFRCIVKDVSGKTVTSNIATLTVATAAAIVITKQPVDVTTAVGTTAKFIVTAEGTGLSYQWQIKTVSNPVWTNIGSGKATLSASASAERNGAEFRCIISDANGNTVTSDTATLTTGTAAAIVITKQPVNVTTAVGTTAKFIVTAEGTGLTYQWQIKTVSNPVWTNIGSGKATLSASASAERNGAQFRCIISDANGNTVTSDTVTLTAGTAAGIVITKQPVNVTAALGGTAKFAVTAEGTGLTYQWQIKLVGADWTNIGTGKATLSASASAPRNGAEFRCIITDANGNTVTTSTATLTVK